MVLFQNQKPILVSNTCFTYCPVVCLGLKVNLPGQQQAKLKFAGPLNTLDQCSIKLGGVGQKFHQLILYSIWKRRKGTN